MKIWEFWKPLLGLPNLGSQLYLETGGEKELSTTYMHTSHSSNQKAWNSMQLEGSIFSLINTTISY